MPAAVVLVLHGAVHVLGFLLLWEIAEVGDLSYAGASPEPGTAAARLVGIGWIVAAALFVIAGLLVARVRPHWRTAAAAGCIVSIPVLLPVAADAAAGLVLDVAILIAVVVAGQGSGSAEARGVT